MTKGARDERIDETIDRVATQLIELPVDRAFTATLRDRLRAPQRRANAVRLWSFAAATVAIAIVGWQLVSRSGGSWPGQRESASPAVSDSATVLSDARPLVPPAPLAGTVTAEAVGLGESVAPLVLMEELTIPAVSLAPLEVANIEIGNLAGGSEFEEPQ